MALFGFGKDGKRDENLDVESLSEEEQNADSRQRREAQEDGGELPAVLNDGRRFFFVAEEISPVRGGTVVTGIIHGRVDLEDEVYILQPRKPVLRAAVEGMETRIESYMMKIQTATDMGVNIFMPVNPADVRKFSVLTSVKPQLKPEGGDSVENPLVASLLFEKRLFSNEEYFDWMCLALIRGCFVTVARTERQTAEHSEGPMVLEKDTTVGFCMLPDPKNKRGRLLPVFTDETELGKWESVAGDERAQKVLLSFPDIASVVNQFKCSGFVLNPYSRNQCIISRAVLAAILESDGYKQIASD